MKRNKKRGPEEPAGHFICVMRPWSDGWRRSVRVLPAKRARTTLAHAQIGSVRTYVDVVRESSTHFSGRSFLQTMDACGVPRG